MKLKSGIRSHDIVRLCLTPKSESLLAQWFPSIYMRYLKSHTPTYTTYSASDYEDAKEQRDNWRKLELPTHSHFQSIDYGILSQLQFQYLR